MYDFWVIIKKIVFFFKIIVGIFLLWMLNMVLLCFFLVEILEEDSFDILIDLVNIFLDLVNVF